MKSFMSMESKRAESLLRIFCAALMLSLGFAHKPVLAAPIVTLDEAYRLPDGSFAEICSEHAGCTPSSHDKRKHSSDAILFCEACLLASSILLPTPGDAVWLRTNAAWLENAPGQKRESFKTASLKTNHARGPPVSSF